MCGVYHVEIILSTNFITWYLMNCEKCFALSIKALVTCKTWYKKRMTIFFINSRGVITWQKSQQKGTKLITLFSRFVKMSNMFTSHPVFTLRSHRIRHLHQHVVLLSLLGLYDSYCARSEMNRKVKKLQTIFVSLSLNYFNSFRRFSVKTFT